GQTRLTNNATLDQMPAWSPDNSKIAFMSNRDGNPEIYRMNADGTGQVNLTNRAGVDARPSWSRKGDWIVYARANGSTNATWEIYKIRGDGSNVTRVTNDMYYDDYPYIK
ncbi:MAG TPA: hypothetical protein VGD26_10640, partial [Chitinophagaceae bacterium]